MDGRPRVTIAVPVHNGERFVGEALHGAAAQTFGEIEILISDNASTDGTEEICRDFAARDPRVRYTRLPENRGGVANFNRLLELASGATFKIAAADDVMRPRFVEACLDALAAAPDAVMAYPRTQIIDGEGAITEDLDDVRPFGDQSAAHDRLASFLQGQAAHLVYGLFRTDVVRATRGFRRTIGNDIVLLTEVACRGPFALAPEQLFLQRRHAGQFSSRGAGGQVAFHAPHSRRVGMPQLTLDLEIARGIASAPLGRAEKLRCLAVATRWWFAPRWRGVAGDVRRLVVAR